MKHIKIYNLFERETKVFESDDFDINQDIKDIFLELEDDGFTINLGQFNGLDKSTKWHTHIIQIIKKSNDGSFYTKEDFLLREICDSILVLESYLEDTEYCIQDITAKRISESGDKLIADISWVKNLDPKLNFQELAPDEHYWRNHWGSYTLLNMILEQVEIRLRKKK